MEDRDVAAAGRRIGERPHVAFQSRVNRQREEIRLVAGVADHLADAAGAVADRVTFVGRRHPLIDDHGGGSPVGIGRLGTAGQAVHVDSRLASPEPEPRTPDLQAAPCRAPA